MHKFVQLVHVGYVQICTVVCNLYAQMCVQPLCTDVCITFIHWCVCNPFARMCIFIHGCVCNPFARMCLFIHGELCNPYARMCIFIHGWVYRGTVWEPPCSPDFFLASTCFSILALCGKIICSLDFFLASTYFSIWALWVACNKCTASGV